jgi:hypothetical protein
MPILGQGDVIKALDQAIDDRHLAIAVGNRKRSPRQKSFCTSIISSKSSGRIRIT